MNSLRPDGSDSQATSTGAHAAARPAVASPRRGAGAPVDGGPRDASGSVVGVSEGEPASVADVPDDARVSGVGVLDKALDILGALDRGPLDLAGLQRATGIPRATAHRLAVALEAHHMVRRDAQGRFCLGFELIRLGRVAADTFPLAELATPALVALRDTTGESVQLYVREGAARRCVVSLQSGHALQWLVPVGALLPMNVGSAGKVLSGGSAPAVAESVEEREPGVASVSAAVFDRSGTVVAAVSVSGPVERLTRTPAATFGAAVEAAAATITAALR